ncbi:DMT family transporter [Pelagibius litoralis]|uniref:DMT family transporter n=1 Tax=Pelagibius litoralis TaxID=374515 RepID=A0A967EX47_9PROT|nr:DMT family transporter [Pelagibius litoralis]NIA67670.1 DMT family transporter [Pelagibius litoralis]
MSQSGAVRPEAVLLGCSMIVAAVFMVSLGDALVKWVSADLSLWQVFVTRSLLAIPLCLLLLRFLGQPLTVAPGNAGWVFLRCLLQVMMWITFYIALPDLSLPVAAAALYTAPLFITLFSSLLIGEAVGRRRGCAIVLGFAGVLFVIRPGSDAFSYATLLPILSAACYALAMIITRGKCAAENPFVLALCLSALLLLFGVAGSGGIALLGLESRDIAANPFLLGPWSSMGGQDWALLAVLSILLVGASAAAAKAYQSAPPATVATFDYSYLLFAIFWGVLFFSELPDGTTLVGMIMIGGAGLLVIRRGRRRRMPLAENAD